MLYLQHYGLAEAPFRITPHVDFFFAGANRGATLDALCYAIVGDEGIVKIGGEVGSGKTMLCRMVMERLPAHVDAVYLANPSLSRDDILHAIAAELGMTVAAEARSGAVMRALQETLLRLHAAGRQVVVLIDEAHAMPKETLEEIRLLSNLETRRHKLLQIVLFGQPELDQILARDDMRQLRERITHQFNLQPLKRDDIAAYLDFRLRAAGYRGAEVFSPAAVKLLAEASGGLTRRVNILADKALLAAFAAGKHAVGTAEARAAIRDSLLGDAWARSGAVSAWGWAAGGALAVLLVATAFAALLLMPAGRFEPVSQRVPHGTAAVAASAVGAELSDGATAAAALQPDAATGVPAGVSANVSTSVPSTARPNGAPLLDAALAAGAQWLAGADERRWVVQLLTVHDARQRDVAEQFLRTAAETGLAGTVLRAYHTRRGEIDRIGLYCGDFATASAAQQFADGLPAALRYGYPQPRQTVRLKP